MTMPQTRPDVVATLAVVVALEEGAKRRGATTTVRVATTGGATAT